MSISVPETDRAAELRTLEDELSHMKNRLNCARQNGKRIIIKQIAQIHQDIARNQEQMMA